MPKANKKDGSNHTTVKNPTVTPVNISDTIPIELKNGHALKKMMRTKRVKYEGRPGAGKTKMYLSEIEMHLKNGVPPEMIRIFIVDFDYDGITDNLDFIPEEYLDCIVTMQCTTVEEAFALRDTYLKKEIPEHLNKFWDDETNASNAHEFTYLVHENECALYESIKNYSFEHIYGMTEQELMETKRKKAVKVGMSEMSREHNPREEYGAINRMYKDYFGVIMQYRQKLGFNFIMTTTMKEKVENFGTKNEKRWYESAGKPLICDHWFSYIFECIRNEEIKNKKPVVNYLLRAKKLRGNLKYFIMENPDAEKLWSHIGRK